jgi:hypothetical protein
MDMAPDVEDGGWVCLWRKSLKTLAWLNPNDWKVWCWCLMRANHQAETVYGNKLQPGQFLTSTVKGPEECDMARSTWQDCMRRLAEWGNVRHEPGTRFTVVTVCNWGRYNDKDHQPRHEPGTIPAEPRQNPGTIPAQTTSKQLNKGTRKREMSLPDEMSDLTELWEAWIADRKRARRPLTPRGAAIAIGKLQRMSAGERRTSLENAIEGGWRGLYPPGGNGSAKGKRRKELYKELGG